MISLSTVPAPLGEDQTIGIVGSVFITVSKDRQSATIHRSDTRDVYAAVKSAEEAKTVLTRGVQQYELYIGGTDYWDAGIAELVRDVKRALVTA